MPHPGDLNADWSIDLKDYALLQRCFSGENVPYEPGCWSADIEPSFPPIPPDGDVDLADFELFRYYLETEFSPPLPSPRPGDLDYDGDVGLYDLAEFMGCLTGPGPYGVASGCHPMIFPLADLDDDGDVDLADFAAICRLFGVP